MGALAEPPVQVVATLTELGTSVRAPPPLVSNVSPSTASIAATRPSPALATPSVRELLLETPPTDHTAESLMASAAKLDLEAATILVPLISQYQDWTGLALHLSLLETEVKSLRNVAGVLADTRAELARVRVQTTTLLKELGTKYDKVRLQVEHWKRN